MNHPENDPIELAAIERGAGDPVVLVHGGVFHSGPAWAKSLGPLVDSGYRAIAVDRRGHGRSDPGDAERVSVHLHADDLRYTLELRDSRMMHLVGVSYGSLVCLEFAQCWPERVLSMTLVEPPIITWAKDEPDYEPWYDRFVQVRKEAADGAPLTEWVPAWLRLIDSGMSKAVTPDSPYWQIVERQAPLIYKEEGGWEYRPDDERLEMLTLPTLVLNGEQSEPPMQFIGEMLAKKLPLATHQWVPGGHDFHAQNSEDFNYLLLQFLKANS